MCPFPKSHHGFTMLPLILFMFVIVGLISAGYIMLGPKVQLGKTVEAKAGLEKSVDAIISWSVANGRIPDSSIPKTTPTTYFSDLISNPNDSWGKPFVYRYESSMALAPNGLCGIKTTNSTHNGQFVAFVLFLGGDDFTTTQSNGLLPARALTTSGATPDLPPQDLYRVVTLDELQNRAGCYGTTQGRLKILNNELPSGKVSINYSATIFAGGGAPFVVSGQNQYRWCVEAANANGIQFTCIPSNVAFLTVTSGICLASAENPNGNTGNWRQGSQLKLDNQPTASTSTPYSYTIFVRDNADTRFAVFGTSTDNDNIAQKTFNMAVQ